MTEVTRGPLGTAEGPDTDPPDWSVPGVVGFGDAQTADEPVVGTEDGPAEVSVPAAPRPPWSRPPGRGELPRVDIRTEDAEGLEVCPAVLTDCGV